MKSIEVEKIFYLRYIGKRKSSCLLHLLDVIKVIAMCNFQKKRQCWRKSGGDMKRACVIPIMWVARNGRNAQCIIVQIFCMPWDCAYKYIEEWGKFNYDVQWVRFFIPVQRIVSQLIHWYVYLYVAKFEAYDMLYRNKKTHLISQ